MAILFQPPLPPAYKALSDEEMAERIRAHKARWGRELVILGHHYQQDDVIQFADFTGDSLKLSQLAAGQDAARYVVFCGVHFMAESADILCNTGRSGEEVTVILPDLSAGCSMADMAAIEQLEDAWDHLTSVTDATIIPITYVNSSAAVKAFVGRHGGACCTSSNARMVLEWALTQGDKVIFLPDQHLGRNTAYALGYPLDAMVVYDPHLPAGGLSDEQVEAARFFLWKGHCSVHGLFTEKQVDAIRASDPECKVLVHPECRWEVVQKADLAGSTEYIIKTIDTAPEGSRWAVGTEMHLVNRLAKKYAGVKHIRSLAGMQCLCTTMYRIDMKHLLWCLDELAEGRVVNHIRVDDQTRHWAVVALQRMLDNVSAQPVAAK
jgi:quinolinate synthase